MKINTVFNSRGIMLFEFNFNFMHKLFCRKQQMKGKEAREEMFAEISPTHQKKNNASKMNYALNGCIITKQQVERS